MDFFSWKIILSNFIQGMRNCIVPVSCVFFRFRVVIFLSSPFVNVIAELMNDFQVYIWICNLKHDRQIEMNFYVRKGRRTSTKVRNKLRSSALRVTRTGAVMVKPPPSNSGRPMVQIWRSGLSWEVQPLRFTIPLTMLPGSPFGGALSVTANSGEIRDNSEVKGLMRSHARKPSLTTSWRACAKGGTSPMETMDGRMMEKSLSVSACWVGLPFSGSIQKHSLSNLPIPPQFAIL